MTGPGHHIVSRGYLRNFADKRGLIQLVWRNTLQAVTTPTGVGAVFKRTNFNTYRSSEGNAFDDLEDEWARVEGLALPLLRRAAEGDKDDETCAAVKVVAAMHLTRSEATHQLWKRTAQEHRHIDEEGRARIEEAFQDEEGRPPEPGEIDAAFGAYFDANMMRNEAFVQQMVSTHNRLLEELPNNVQLVRRNTRSAIGFITADIPVVIIDGPLTGFLAGVGIRTAENCLFPLSRDTAAFLTTRAEPDAVVAPYVVQQLNHRIWHGSLRQFVCHPDEDWHRALARRIPPRDEVDGR